MILLALVVGFFRYVRLGYLCGLFFKFFVKVVYSSRFITTSGVVVCYFEPELKALNRQCYLSSTAPVAHIQ